MVSSSYLVGEPLESYWHLRHVDSKTLHQQNPPVLNLGRGHRLTYVDMYDDCKVVFVCIVYTVKYLSSFFDLQQ